CSMSSATAPRRCGKRRRAVMASASGAASTRVSAWNRRKSYCARRCVRLSTTWHSTFLEAPVRAGAFLLRHLRLWPVVMPLPHFVAVGGPPEAELDFRAQRAHLPPRLCGQHLSQIILEADREAPILIRVVSHRNPLVGWRHVGAWP